MLAPLHLGIGLYHAAIRLAAPFSPKARAWAEGRRGLWERLAAKADALQGCLWMHCASVGEFEQGRPVLEALKERHPGMPVLITFFSPSGYRARRAYPLATHVEYLPADGRAAAERFLQLVRPAAVLWVKYEFWPHWLHALRRHRVPVHLISGIFRPGQPFFRWWGGAHRAMLGCFARIFVQDEASAALLASIGIRDARVAGDTRFDRVDAIARQAGRLPLAQAFRGSAQAPVLVAGSTWPADEALIAAALRGMPSPPRLIAAPHEPTEAALARAERIMPRPVERWSLLEARLSALAPRGADAPSHADPLRAATLLMDAMGLLAPLYQHGDAAYVGGGFGDGIHSVLEAAAWGKPVIFGPRHRKFAEASGLIEAGGGFEVRDARQLQAVLTRLLADPGARTAAAAAALGYVRERVGATRRIVDEIGPLGPELTS